MFYTYILFSKKINKYYVGNTNNIEKRLIEHNRGKTTFTKTGIPWELKYFETFQTKAEASKREYFIKSRKSRLYIESLILQKGSEHPA
jgi:putative endonuclease